MSKTEWRTIDKAPWGAGEWRDEPDKVQWVDEATGLDCLIVRGPHGALCGYVGVPEGHPWYGVDYSACTEGCGEDWCDHSPESRVTVHGGITFSDGCHEPTREQWEAIPEHITARLAEAARYPMGDAARNVRELREQSAMTFEEWTTHQMARRICHVPAEGRPARVWWFGFDCAHSGDQTPESDARTPSLAIVGRAYSTYRTRGYVEGECRDLARQLEAIQ